jgi:hypothetical protein
MSVVDGGDREGRVDLDRALDRELHRAREERLHLFEERGRGLRFREAVLEGLHFGGDAHRAPPSAPAP